MEQFSLNVSGDQPVQSIGEGNALDLRTSATRNRTESRTRTSRDIHQSMHTNLHVQKAPPSEAQYAIFRPWLSPESSSSNGHSTPPATPQPRHTSTPAHEPMQQDSLPTQQQVSTNSTSRCQRTSQKYTSNHFGQPLPASSTSSVLRSRAPTLTTALASLSFIRGSYLNSSCHALNSPQDSALSTPSVLLGSHNFNYASHHVSPTLNLQRTSSAVDFTQQPRPLETS